MSQLKLTHRMEGLEIRFPSKGLPSTSRAGKVYQTLFWVAVFSPVLISTGDGKGAVMLAPLAALGLILLALRVRKLRMLLNHEAVRINAPHTRHTIPLEEIDRVELATEKDMSMHYVVIHHNGKPISVDALLRKADAQWLTERLQAAVDGRKLALAGQEQDKAEPPAALAALMKAAREQT